MGSKRASPNATAQMGAVVKAASELAMPASRCGSARHCATDAMAVARTSADELQTHAQVQEASLSGVASFTASLLQSAGI